MADNERIMIVPLRKEMLKAPRYRRTKKAVNALREFIAHHTKAKLDDVKLGIKLNNEMWKNGIQNPPHKVKVVVTKDDKGIVTAELFGAKVEKKAVDKQAEKKAKRKEAKAKDEAKADAHAEKKELADAKKATDAKKKAAKKEE